MRNTRLQRAFRSSLSHLHSAFPLFCCVSAPPASLPPPDDARLLQLRLFASGQPSTREVRAHNTESSRRANLPQAHFNFAQRLLSVVLCCRLFAALIHVLEGDIESFPITAMFSSNNSSNGNSAGVAVAGVSVALVRHSALQLLVHILCMQAQWAGVPGIARLGRVPPPLDDATARAKKSAWQERLSQHQRKLQIEEQALQLAKGGKIKAVRDDRATSVKTRVVRRLCAHFPLVPMHFSVVRLCATCSR